MSQIIKDDHFCLLAAKDIDDVCKPLKMIGITSFDYVRTFDDGSKITLCNNAVWLSKYYNEKFYKSGNFEKHPKNYTSGVALWSSMLDQKVFSYGRNYFDIDNGITIKKASKDAKSCEFYFFGGPCKDKWLVEFLINNLELLDHFIFYFKDRAAKIIKKSLQSRIYLPESPMLLDTAQELVSSINLDGSVLFRNFFKETKIKKLKLEIEGKSVYLTEKEYIVALLLVSGCAPSVIANKIYRSTKTINRHIENIKLKLNCHKRERLIEILQENGFEHNAKCLSSAFLRKAN